MLRYCPKCGEILPKDSRLCPNCDKDRIDAKRLSLQARSNRAEDFAPDSAGSFAHEPSHPVAKKGKGITIAVIAAVVVALIICGVFVGINIMSNGEKSDTDTENSEVAYDDEFYLSAEKYFRNAVLPQYNNFENSFAFTVGDNGYMIVDGLDKLLIDYALVDLDNNGRCDIVTVELSSKSDDNSLLAVYKQYFGTDKGFIASKSRGQHLKCYESYSDVVSARFYINGQQNYNKILSLSDESSDTRVDTVIVPDGRKFVYSKSNDSFMKNGDLSSADELNSALKEYGMPMFSYSDDEPDFSESEHKGALVVKYHCENGVVSFESYVNSETEDDYDNETVKSAPATPEEAPKSVAERIDRAQTNNI